MFKGVSVFKGIYVCSYAAVKAIGVSVFKGVMNGWT